MTTPLMLYMKNSELEHSTTSTVQDNDTVFGSSVMTITLICFVLNWAAHNWIVTAAHIFAMFYAYFSFVLSLIYTYTI